MAFRAIFFDFDGTLADSYAAITASVNCVRAHYSLTPLAESMVRSHVGRGLDYLLRNTIPDPDISADSIRYRAHYRNAQLSGTHLLPGAAEVIPFLQAQGLRLAICSNKPRDFTTTLVKHLGLGDYFTAVLGPEDVSNIKPAPDMLLLGLQRLGVSATEAVYIGDMVLDIQTARGAGVNVWIVPTGSDDRATIAAAEPDRILTSLNELAELGPPSVNASA